MREALSRLAAEKWTVATAQKGYSVSPVSVEELKDLTRTRITIEQLCLRAAIAHGDVEWETAVVAAYHRLRRIPMVAETGQHLSPAWAAAHTTFHAALVAGCDSAWMLTLRAMLYAQSERYRHLSFALGQANRDVEAEHEAIVEACLARDAERACYADRTASQAHVGHSVEFAAAARATATRRQAPRRCGDTITR